MDHDETQTVTDIFPKHLAASVYSLILRAKAPLLPYPPYQLEINLEFKLDQQI